MGGSPGLHPPHRCGPLRFSPAAGGASGDLRGTGGRGGSAASPQLGRAGYGRVFVPVRAGAARGRRGRAVLTQDRAAPAPLPFCVFILRRSRCGGAEERLRPLHRGDPGAVTRLVRGASGSVCGPSRSCAPGGPEPPAAPERGRWEAAAAARMEHRCREPPVPPAAHAPTPSCTLGAAVVLLPTHAAELWGQRQWPEGQSPKSRSAAPAPTPYHPLVLPLVLFLVRLFFGGFYFFFKFLPGWRCRTPWDCKGGGGLSRGEDSARERGAVGTTVGVQSDRASELPPGSLGWEFGLV